MPARAGFYPFQPRAFRRLAPRAMARMLAQFGLRVTPRSFLYLSLPRGALHRRHQRRGDVRVKIALRLGGQHLAQLVLQNPRRHFLDRALAQLAELERPERQTDQPVYIEADMFEHPLDLAVLALAQAHGQPDIGALLAVKPGVDALIVHAVNGHAFAQAVEHALVGLAIGAHAVAPHPAGLGQFQHPREAAVIGHEQQALGIDVEAANSHQPRQLGRQSGEDGGPPLGVAVSRHEPARLVEEEEPGALAPAQRFAVHNNLVAGSDVESRAGQHHAIDHNAPLRDPALRVAARAQAGARHHLGDAGVLRRVLGRGFGRGGFCPRAFGKHRPLAAAGRCRLDAVKAALCARTCGFLARIGHLAVAGRAGTARIPGFSTGFARAAGLVVFEVCHAPC